VRSSFSEGRTRPVSTFEMCPPEEAGDLPGRQAGGFADALELGSERAAIVSHPARYCPVEAGVGSAVVR
jgi:hypothetical protein